MLLLDSDLSMASSVCFTMAVDPRELCFTCRDSSFVSDNTSFKGRGRKKSIPEDVEEKENDKQPTPIALRLSSASKLFVPFP